MLVVAFALLVIVAALALWCGAKRRAKPGRPMNEQGDEPTVLSVDLSDREP
jgi:hypothetical protein